MTVEIRHVLSTATEDLNWSILELFASPVARISLLRCRPNSLECSCEKCAVDNQLVFVTHGGFIRHTGKSSQVANAGKATLFRASEPYRTSHIDPSGDTCIVFSFPDRALSAAQLRPLAGDAVCIAIRPCVFASAVRLAAGIKRRSLGALEAEECSFALLNQVLSTSTVRNRAAAARTIVNDIEAELTADPGADWSLAQLARKFRRNAFYITRSFREVTGAPLHRYLVNLRLSTALGRLADGEEDLATLALDLGFSSHAHFSTAFKSALGRRPSDFRTMTQSDVANAVKNLKARKLASV